MIVFIAVSSSWLSIPIYIHKDVAEKWEPSSICSRGYMSVTLGKIFYRLSEDIGNHPMIILLEDTRRYWQPSDKFL
jgi:hypothetical protein